MCLAPCRPVERKCALTVFHEHRCLGCSSCLLHCIVPPFLCTGRQPVATQRPCTFQKTAGAGVKADLNSHTARNPNLMMIVGRSAACCNLHQAPNRRGSCVVQGAGIMTAMTCGTGSYALYDMLQDVNTDTCVPCETKKSKRARTKYWTMLLPSSAQNWLLELVSVTMLGCLVRPCTR